MYLCDGPHGGTRVAGSSLLIDRDPRRQTLDEIDIRFVHLTEELAGVGGQRFDVPALTFRVDRVERE